MIGILCNEFIICFILGSYIVKHIHLVFVDWLFFVNKILE